MSNPKPEQDPSMEEILSSIRRIISDEGEEGGEAPPAADASQPDAAAAADIDVEPEPEPEPEDAAPTDGGDVLELTEMVNEDGSVTSLADEGGVEDAPDDVSDDAPDDVSDDAIEDPEAEAPEAAGELSVAFEDEDEDLPAPEAVEPDAAPTPETDTPAAPGLVSAATDAAATGAFAALSQTIAAKTAEGSLSLDSSGRTLEDLVKEMLRPMLKEWLDDNLPALTERLVQREIQRMAGRAEDD